MQWNKQGRAVCSDGLENSLFKLVSNRNSKLTRCKEIKHKHICIRHNNNAAPTKFISASCILKTTHWGFSPFDATEKWVYIIVQVLKSFWSPQEQFSCVCFSMLLWFSLISLNIYLPHCRGLPPEASFCELIRSFHSIKSSLTPFTSVSQRSWFLDSVQIKVSPPAGWLIKLKAPVPPLSINIRIRIFVYRAAVMCSEGEASPSW